MKWEYATIYLFRGIGGSTVLNLNAPSLNHLSLQRNLGALRCLLLASPRPKLSVEAKNENLVAFDFGNRNGAYNKRTMSQNGCGWRGDTLRDLPTNPNAPHF
jgi:hypothetical protein